MVKCLFSDEFRSHQQQSPPSVVCARACILLLLPDNLARTKPNVSWHRLVEKKAEKSSLALTLLNTNVIAISRTETRTCTGNLKKSRLANVMTLDSYIKTFMFWIEFSPLPSQTNVSSYRWCVKGLKKGNDRGVTLTVKCHYFTDSPLFHPCLGNGGMASGEVNLPSFQKPNLARIYYKKSIFFLYFTGWTNSFDQLIMLWLIHV